MHKNAFAVWLASGGRRTKGCINNMVAVETSNHLRAVGNGLLTVECSLGACETLADDARVLVHGGGRAGAHEAAAGSRRLLGGCPTQMMKGTHPCTARVVRARGRVAVRDGGNAVHKDRGSARDRTPKDPRHGLP